MSKRVKNRLVMIILLSVCSIYTGVVYTTKGASSAPEMSAEAIEGQDLWQKNNCASCHQIYGLGGYLGPDLTNVASHPMKNDDYIRAFMNGGVGAMPVFDLSEREKNRILTFLKYVDKTGYYPNRNAVFEKNGWVSITYK